MDLQFCLVQLSSFRIHFTPASFGDILVKLLFWTILQFHQVIRLLLLLNYIYITNILFYFTLPLLQNFLLRNNWVNRIFVILRFVSTTWANMRVSYVLNKNPYLVCSCDLRFSTNEFLVHFRCCDTLNFVT